jgi:beta-1,4-mannosyl-glycoprotein beta-1,4-N-acetylglucosaminyltransferase
MKSLRSVFAIGFLCLAAFWDVYRFASLTSTRWLFLDARLQAPSRFRVFDCFLYNGESLTLLIRLRTLSSLVTTFILGWSNTTFSGRHERPLTYAPYEKEIAVFSQQIYLLWCDAKSAGWISWDREGMCRRHLIVGVHLQNPHPDDLVLLADLDEIPRPSALRAIIEKPPTTYVKFRARFFYYSLRYLSPSPWIRNVLVRYRAINRSLDWYRDANDNVVPGFTAVHCSYCFGTVRQIIFKLQTFSHTELSGGMYVDPDFIVARAACGDSLFAQTNGSFQLIDLDLNELNLPPDAEFMKWRLPFVDLHTMDLDVDKIKRLAFCNVDLKIVDGKVYGYE